MLRADELARIQAVNASWLPQLCDITRPGTTQTDDGFPGAASAVVVASAVPCRVEPEKTSGNERNAAGGIAAVDRWFVVMGHDTPTLTPMDTIDVDGVGRFEIQTVNAGRGVVTDVTARCVRIEAV